MYEQNVKFGQAIVVCGARPSVGTSTAAAMVASVLANEEDRTLLISTDYTHPYDAPSLLSDTVLDSYMDDLVALEISNAMTPSNLEEYATGISDHLYYTRLSTKLSTITTNPARTLVRILDTACRAFRYVVLDLDFQNSVFLHKLSEHTNFVIYLFGQDFQSLRCAKSMQEQNIESDIMTLPVVMNLYADIPFNEETIAKALGTDTVLAIEHDPEIFKAALRQDIAGMIYRGSNKHTGFKGFFRKKDAENVETAAFSAVSTICALMKENLTVEGGDKS